MEISILELSIYQIVFRQRSLTDMLPYNDQKSYEDRQKRQYSLSAEIISGYTNC